MITIHALPLAPEVKACEYFLKWLEPREEELILELKVNVTFKAY